MTDREDLLLFDGLDLEEPSEATDRAILAMARARQTGSPRAMALLHLALAASVAAAILFFFPGERREAPVEAAGGTVSTVQAIGEIRDDFGQIQEMTEKLIPEERQEERAAIEAKLRICLSSLEEIEAKLNTFDDSGLIGMPDAKEVRI